MSSPAGDSAASPRASVGACRLSTAQRGCRAHCCCRLPPCQGWAGCSPTELAQQQQLAAHRQRRRCAAGLRALQLLPTLSQPAPPLPCCSWPAGGAGCSAPPAPLPVSAKAPPPAPDCCLHCLQHHHSPPLQPPGPAGASPCCAALQPPCVPPLPRLPPPLQQTPGVPCRLPAARRADPAPPAPASRSPSSRCRGFASRSERPLQGMLLSIIFSAA